VTSVEDILAFVDGERTERHRPEEPAFGNVLRLEGRLATIMTPVADVAWLACCPRAKLQRLRDAPLAPAVCGATSQVIGIAESHDI
jgi:hypothetical protein